MPPGVVLSENDSEGQQQPKGVSNQGDTEDAKSNTCRPRVPSDAYGDTGDGPSSDKPDDKLAHVIDAWPGLPDEAKAVILATVRAYGGAG